LPNESLRTDSVLARPRQRRGAGRSYIERVNTYVLVTTQTSRSTSPGGASLRDSLPSESLRTDSVLARLRRRRSPGFYNERVHTCSPSSATQPSRSTSPGGRVVMPPRLAAERVAPDGLRPRPATPGPPRRALLQRARQHVRARHDANLEIYFSGGPRRPASATRYRASRYGRTPSSPGYATAATPGSSTTSASTRACFHRAFNNTAVGAMTDTTSPHRQTSSSTSRFSLPSLSPARNQRFSLRGGGVGTPTSPCPHQGLRHWLHHRPHLDLTSDLHLEAPASPRSLVSPKTLNSSRPDSLARDVGSETQHSDSAIGPVTKNRKSQNGLP